VKPNLVFKGTAVVTTFADVQEILSRNDVFHVPYAEKMAKVTDGGGFYLGMQETPTYTRDVSNMRLVMRREDIADKVTPFVVKASDDILNSAGGSIDVVQELSRIVPARLLGEYFGTPGWNEQGYIDANTIMFQYLFYPDDPAVTEKALAAAAQTRKYLDKLLTKRQTKRGRKDDVIKRCLALQDADTPGMDNETIRNMLIGLSIGAIPTNSKCVALTLDYLFDHPDLLAAAQQAARQDDDQAMVQTVLECLRFNAFSPGVQRICSEDYVVANGTLRRATIPKGTKVIAATQSAMMDCRELKSPRKFLLDRPLYHYMHWGYSLHTCSGQYMNLTTIPQMVKAVLKREGLHRVAKMESEGPFPVSLKVTYNA
jgi:cytochrome P450